MPIPTMTSKDCARTVEPMRWGLIPSWARDMKGGFSTFNARSDTVDSKPPFRGAWKAGRRCLVLVGGFYEWRRAGVADKQPFAIAMGNHQVMPLAGLSDGGAIISDIETAPTQRRAVAKLSARPVLTGPLKLSRSVSRRGMP